MPGSEDRDLWGGGCSQGRLHGRGWPAFQRKRILDRQREMRITQ